MSVFSSHSHPLILCMTWTPERKITEMAKDDEECKLCAVIFRGLCNVPDSGLEHNSESVSVLIIT